MSISIFSATQIKQMLREDKNNIVIVPSPMDVVTLNKVYDIPLERIGFLASICAVQSEERKQGQGCIFLKMTRRQYAYWKRQETKLLGQLKERG